MELKPDSSVSSTDMTVEALVRPTIVIAGLDPAISPAAGAS